MILTAIEIRTTSDNVSKGNIVEFAAATCDVEDTARRWQTFERLIDNDTLIGSVDGFVRCESQLRLIKRINAQARSKRSNLLIRENKLVNEFRDWISTLTINRKTVLNVCGSKRCFSANV